MGQGASPRSTRVGRSATPRRLGIAAIGFLIAMSVVPGCDDKENASGDGGGRDVPASASEPAPSSDGGSDPTGTDGPTDDGGPTDRPAGDDDGDDRPGRPRPSDDSSPRPNDGDGTPTTSAGWSGPRFGAVYHGMWDMTWSDRAELLDKLVAMGARWVRIGLQWSLVQPDRPTARDPGWSSQWGVPKADRVIRQAVRRGLKVSITFLRTPDWANGGAGPERLPSDPATYARAIEWLAQRYRDQVYAWEIFNETNNPNHLQAPVGDYVELLCQAYSAVHRGDPTTRVLFGGTSGNDYEYIDAAYRNGAKGCFDVLATHPYNADLSPLPDAPSEHRWWFRNIELVRDVMVRHGDQATPVWFTEVGWSTHANTAQMSSSERGVTQDQQARYAVQVLRITKRDYPYVERLAWYAARDETSSTLDNNNFGLFTLGLDPKPAAIALEEFLTSR